jgi:4-hydroxybenzoate polyprenyltransferase
MDNTVSRQIPNFNSIWSLPSVLLRCIEEARPSVLCIQFIRFAVGTAIAARITGHWLPLRAGIGAFSWELAIFWTYLFNGVMDIQEDRVNGSRRPIASGALSPSAAVVCAVSAAPLALVGAALLGLPVFLTVLAMLVIGWQYSAPPFTLKRGPAGTAVSGAALGFLAYLAGFLSQATRDNLRPDKVALIFVLTMSAWMAFVGTPAKELPDIQGDAAAGRRTLVLMWGEVGTRRVLVVAALAIGIMFSLAAAFGPPLLRWPAVALVMGGSAITLVSLNNISTGSRSRRRLPYRIFMLTQYAGNACLLMGMLVLVLRH